MPGSDHGPSIKDDEQYEALRDDGMSKEKAARIAGLFAEAAWEVDQREFQGLTLDTRIAELGVDSVVLLEIFGYVEEELEVYLPHEDLGQVKTLRDLGALIQRA